MNSRPSTKGTTSILIVSNEPATAPVWGYMIRERKLHAVIETSPQNAIRRCEEHKPALTILDLQLPHAKLLDLCLKLRANCGNPILLFLPFYDENLIIEYYDAGIDDCVVKPISPAVFYVKVRAWLQYSRMQPVPAMEESRVGEMVLNPDQRLFVAPGGRTVKLTDLEVRLLHLLMSRPGYVFDADYIVNKVWGLYGEQDLSLLKHAIYRLRRKLEDDPDHPRWIQNLHGKGYNFTID